MMDSETQELQDRLSLIESMIAESRQRTESWGWSFVLWGVAYYVAIAWATWAHSSLAWPVTMLGTAAVTAILSSRQGRKEPETTMGRAIGAIWICMGLSLFIFCVALSASGRGEQHVFLAVIEMVLGCANATSSIILKWKAQFVTALVWWAAAVFSCFGTINQTSTVFLVAIFFGQIVFGTYMMISEARERKLNAGNSGTAHA